MVKKPRPRMSPTCGCASNGADCRNQAGSVARAANTRSAASTIVDGRVRTTVRVSHYHGLKRLIASMPGVATVVAPPEARAVVADWAAAGAARYR